MIRSKRSVYIKVVLFATVIALPNILFSQATLPAPDHIVILILENHSYDEVIGNTAGPHINALAVDDHAALFTQSFAIEHPSQPNYLDFYSGCNQGITDDALPALFPFTTDNLGSQLITGGYTFVTYSEDLPSIGFNGASSGNYARKHNPAANWMGTGTNQIPITTNQPFNAFPTDYTKLPTVCYVVPNQNNDMHNGSFPANLTTADNWLYKNLNSYIQWAKTHNSLFILTFDEDDYSGSNQIATIFSGQMIKPGKYSEAIDHYSVLRTIEDLYGLPYACNASTASSITDIWNNSSSVIVNGSASDVFSVYPNPSVGGITLHIEESKIGKLGRVGIFNELGKKIFEAPIENVSTQEILSRTWQGHPVHSALPAKPEDRRQKNCSIFFRVGSLF